MATTWTLLALSLTAVEVATSQPCRWLLMTGVDNMDVFPYSELSGLYSITDETLAGFPTYRHEVHGHETFHYNTTLRALVLGNQLLLGLTTGHLPRPNVTYPYDDAITLWRVYQPATDDYRWASAHTITPRCVDNDPTLQLCNSGLVTFNENLRLTDLSINITKYSQMYGQYSASYRPVYQAVATSHLRTKVYLYHAYSMWRLGYNYRTSTFAKVLDSALRPEFITGTWQLQNNDEWQRNPNLRLECVGVQEATSCNEVQCLNGGTCISAGPQNILCKCPPGYHGPRCKDQVPACQFFGNWTTSYGGFYYTLSSYEGNLAAWFCPRGSKPEYGYSMCGRYSWSNYPSCRSMTTTTQQPWWNPTTRYRYPSSRDRRDLFEGMNAWLAPTVILSVILIQVFAPFIIYYVLTHHCGFRKKTTKTFTKADDEENKAVAAEYKKRLEELESRTLKPENSVTISELRGIMQQLEEDVDKLRAKRRQRDQEHQRTVKLMRIVSFYYYISFWLWMIYMIIAFGAQLGQYAFLFGILAVIAIVFMFILPIVFLIESCCSSEWQYIKNLGLLTSATDRIETIRKTQPRVKMNAECYHFELRTRTVYYTDANGNTQSRTETYQEKVVTAFIVEPFVFTHWYDSSKATLTDVRKVGITKIKMELTVEFGNQQTAQLFNARFTRFQDENRYRDLYVNFFVTKAVDGFEKRLAAYTDADNKPGWVGSLWFWLATMSCLGWPYRIAFNRATGRTEYSVVKVIFVNSTSSEAVATGTNEAGGSPTEMSEETTISKLKNGIQTTIDKLTAGPSAENDDAPIRCAATEQHMNVALTEAKHIPQAV